MLYRNVYFMEGKRDFIRRVVRLMRYVAADPSLNMYYAYSGFSSMMFDDVASLPGYRLVLDGQLPKHKDRPNSMRFGNGTGVFQLEEEGLVDPEVFADGFCLYSDYWCYVAVTEEEDFPRKIRPKMSSWSGYQIDRVDVRKAICSHDRSMMLDCAFDEEDLEIIHVTYSTNSEELAKVFADPV